MRLPVLVLVLLASPAIANDHDLLGPTRHDLVASPVVMAWPVNPKPIPIQPTELTPEVTDKYFPAPASDAQMVKLNTGATVTRTRTDAAGYGQSLVLRAQPVRRLFGFFRNRGGLCVY